MKKKNLFLSALLAGAMFMGNAQVAQAQFFPATTLDETAKTFTAQVNVANTGNSQLIVDGKLFRAMVWDGTGTSVNSPAIYVDYDGTKAPTQLLGIPGFASDPDIAAYQLDANTVRLLVSYVKSGTVWIERIDYYLSTNTFSPKNVLTTVSNATYPNVDVNEVGEGVVVYEKNAEIFARTIDLSQTSPILTGEFRVDYEIPGMDEWWATKPDVAIKKNTSGLGSTVSFIYREEYTDASSWQYSDVIVKQETFSTVAASTGTSGTTI